MHEEDAESHHESEDEEHDAVELKADPAMVADLDVDINQALLKALKAEKNTEILNFMADFEPEGKLQHIRETLQI